MDELSQELNVMLEDTFNEIKHIEVSNLKKIGGGNISIAEFPLLECVADDAGKKSTMGDIAHALSVTLPTVAVAVKRLEKKGYVKTSKSRRDGRVTQVELTDEGRTMSRFHDYFHEQLIYAIKKQLTDEEMHCLCGCVKKLNTFLEKRSGLLSWKEGTAFEFSNFGNRQLCA